MEFSFFWGLLAQDYSREIMGNMHSVGKATILTLPLLNLLYFVHMLNLSVGF
jgi:hypothetical protein